MSAEDELPEGWASTTLGEVAPASKEKVEPYEKPKAPYLSLEHVESNTLKIIGRGLATDVKSTKSVFRAGDVLYGKLRPYLNKVAIPTFDGICSTDFVVFPQRPWLVSHYLMWFLSQGHVVEYANHHSSGVSLPRVKLEALKQLEFPLPPLAEQQRIVAKVEELLSQVNAARERLARTAALLKRFRQSVLATACDGRLTADWRGDVSTNGELPEGWKSGHLGDLLQRIEAGKNFTCVERPPSEDEVGVVKVSAVTWGEFRETESKTCTDPEKVNPQYFIQPGDFLFSRANTIELVGACVVVDDVQRTLMLSDKILRFHFNGVPPRWLLYVLRSRHGRNEIERLATGNQASMRNIAQESIKQIEMLVPPENEQHEIVRRADALLTLADAIESRVAGATARAERLTQSILAKAFRGELVPTEAELARAEGRDYEPASVLLERVRAGREGDHAEPRRGRRSR